MNTAIFVYGTLKQGFNNAPILADQTFLGKAVIPGSKYRIVNVHGGRYPFPGLVESEHGSQVFGEAYEVNDACLRHLDLLEGVAHGLYARTQVQVLLVDGRSLETTTYLYTGNLKTEPCGFCWPPKERIRCQLADKSFVKREAGDGGTYYEISQLGKEPILADSLEDLCSELAENWTFFGGAKGTNNDWLGAITEVFNPAEVIE